MNFNKHSDLEGKHAPFSASQSSWLRYDDEKILNTYFNRNRTNLGTELHEYAQTQINLLQKVSSVKSLQHEIATFIYTKYSMLEVPSYGLTLVQNLNCIPREVFETLKLYINDAIGFKMSPEVVLYYSDRFFGTADTICFRNNFLRIHDLKTGDTPIKRMDQLEIYAALFCLEYKIKPGEIDIELRKYQNNEILTHNPTAEDILPIMDKIIHSEKILVKNDYEEA